MKLEDYHRIRRQVKAAVACEWCRKRPGETHFDAQGHPLFDHQHHAGKYITPDEADRISRDGP